jgi:hypothetical protein
VPWAKNSINDSNSRRSISSDSILSKTSAIADQWLTDQDWAVVKDAFSAHGDPLLGKEKGDEFNELFSEIVRMTPAPIGLGDPDA